MNDISKEKADEMLAAWDAASLTERLVMDRVNWITVHDTSYYVTKPSELERNAAARILKLEAMLRASGYSDLQIAAGTPYVEVMGS